MESITKEDLTSIAPDARAAAALETKAEAVAVGKAAMDVPRTFVLAIMAGIQIGLGALFMTYVKADHTLGFAAASVLGGLCFSLGLICVIVAGSELFTGNCLMVMGAGSKKVAWSGVLKNWVVVWVGNLVGSLVLVGVVFGCGLMGTKAGDNTIGAQMVTIAAGKINLDAGQIFFRAILCNLLVCLAVWMGFAGKSVVDKIFTTLFPVMAFVAMGFEHCVANMFFLPMGVIASGAGFGDQTLAWAGAFYNIGIATVGNAVGGVVFVGLIYWFAYRRRGESA